MPPELEELANIVVDMPLGLLINFGGGTFKEGGRRIANGDLER